MTMMLNPRQEAFAQNVVRGMSLTKAYEKAGYSAKGKSATEAASRLISTSVKVRDRLTELRELTARAILEELGAGIYARVVVLKEALEANKIVSTISGTEANAGTVDFIEVPDWPSRLRAADILNKMDGIYELKVSVSHELKETQVQASRTKAVEALTQAREKRKLLAAPTNGAQH